jgi:hypothetical protein
VSEVILPNDVNGCPRAQIVVICYLPHWMKILSLQISANGYLAYFTTFAGINIYPWVGITHT